MKNYLIYLFCLGFAFHLTAQQNDLDSEEEQPKTIVDEFDQIIDDGGNYQEYKVIKKVALGDFKNKLKKSKDNFESEISSLEQEIDNQNKEIKDLKAQLLSTQNALAETEEEKDSMQLFGNNLNKSKFQTIVFGIIGLLILILIIIAIKFKANIASTHQARETLERTEKDFEEYKRSALEKQQKLGRELQDEKNKLSKLKAGGPK